MAGRSEGRPGDVEPAGAGQELVGIFTIAEERDQTFRRSEFPKSFPNPSQNVPDYLGRFFYAYLCSTKQREKWSSVGP